MARWGTHQPEKGRLGVWEKRAHGQLTGPNSNETISIEKTHEPRRQGPTIVSVKVVEAKELGGAALDGRGRRIRTLQARGGRTM